MNFSYRGNYVKKSLLLFKFYLVPFKFVATDVKFVKHTTKVKNKTRTTQVNFFFKINKSTTKENLVIVEVINVVERDLNGNSKTSMLHNARCYSKHNIETAHSHVYFICKLPQNY